jgi:phage protein U
MPKQKKSRSLKNIDNPLILAKKNKADQKKTKKKGKADKKKKKKLTAKQKAEKEKKKAKEAGSATAASPGVFGAFGSTIMFQVKDPYSETETPDPTNGQILHSDHQILIPSQISRDVRGRWTSYSLIGKKPKMSFQGAEQSQVTLNITLDSNHGVNPVKTLDKIRKAIEKGTTEYLVIGGKIVGGSKYYIESMSETWTRFFQGGKVTRATGDIVFAEYH